MKIRFFVYGVLAILGVGLTACDEGKEKTGGIVEKVDNKNEPQSTGDLTHEKPHASAEFGSQETTKSEDASETEAASQESEPSPHQEAEKVSNVVDDAVEEVKTQELPLNKSE